MRPDFCMKRWLFSVLLLAACQAPIDDGSILKVDAYFDGIPADKTAVIVLQNKQIRKNNLEYVQFYRKLIPILKEKGYRPVDENQPHAVILKLYFGVQNAGYLRSRYGVEEKAEPAAADELQPLLSALYTRTRLYAKFLRLTAVDARDPSRELWKIVIIKEGAKSDFRSAQYELLYLLSRYMERDSSVQISGNLPYSEVYQRFVKKLSPSSMDTALYMPMENKYAYAERMQKKINANPAVFAPCGMTEKVEIVFRVSDFGTITYFKAALPDEMRNCVFQALESLTEPPIDIPADEAFIVYLKP